MKLSSIASSLLTAGALVVASGFAFSQTTLNAHPGPSDNGLTNGTMFFDVTATSAGVTITELTTGNSAPANGAFMVEVFVFNGSGLGGPVSAGPGSSPVGWTSLGTAAGTQGATANGISLPVDIPDIVLTQNQVTGVAVKWLSGGGPRYLGTGTPPYSMFSDANLSLTTGDSRSAAFTPTGTFFSSRALVGSLTYTNGGGGPVGTIFCAGDGSGTACPCGNNSTLGAGEGCQSSLGMGARLVASGTASIAADTLVLAGSQMPNSSALYFQGTTQAGAGLGAVFGDGLRCAGGTVNRLKTTTNVAGASLFPGAGDPSISVKGNVTSPGTRTYQVWYRNAAAFCTVSTFNLSNGVEVMWNP